MLVCLKCGSQYVKIIDVRDLGIVFMNVYKCAQCGHKFDEQDILNESRSGENDATE